MENTNKYAIEMIDITKRFGTYYANDHISLKLEKGEILGLCGENGAGKSTLMSILFGLYEPDLGVIKKDGEVVKIKNPNDATSLHIGMIHQHFKLVSTYTVLQNVILGNEPIFQFDNVKNNIFKKFINFINRKLFKVIDYSKAEIKAKGIIEKYGFNIDLHAKICDISVEMQQKTEIIKMLYRDNDILIFDEPTAVLTEQEIQGLLDILNNLKSEGKSIIFISHKLNEIFKVCDHIEVIRLGKFVDYLETNKTTKEEISALMVGRVVNLLVEKEPPIIGKEIFRVENLSMIDPLSKKQIVNNVSFNVRSGEVVCIAGIDGNGQQDLIYGVTGMKKISNGKIFINQEDITKYSIKKKNDAGIAHIPEDRQKYGLVLDNSVGQNSILKSYKDKKFCRFGFINNKNVEKYAVKIIKDFDVRSSQGTNAIVRSMSGGNQQKLIIGREISQGSDFIIAVQPTRGLDVGSIETIHDILLNERKQGKAILLVSLELDQVFTLADRILVMFEGQIVGEFNSKEVTRETLGLYMSGSKIDKVNAIKEGANNE